MAQREVTDLATAALQALPQAVLLADRSGGILFRNEAARDSLPPGSTLAEALHCSMDSGTEVEWSSLLGRLRQDDRPACHSDLKLAFGGATRLIDVHLVALDDAQGPMLVMVVDATPRASMERRLAMSEHLAAVGKLAAQVAHELNNPLDGILRFLGLAERMVSSSQPTRASEYLAQVRTGLERMAQIIDELLDFSRSARRGGKPAAMSLLVSQALQSMSPSLRACGVTVVCDLLDKPVCMLPGSIFQVVCNLVKNAADAMSSGGRLTITARRRGDQAILTFADTGSGIPAENLERIFEPFFSTKPGRQGTGLGLSICRDIVARAGGTVTAGNRPEGGAVFTVTVPCRPSDKQACTGASRGIADQP